MTIVEISQLIKKRRSIFPNMYTNRPIEKEVILQLLENANWAPTHKKTQPWRFIVFQGERLHDLSDYLSNYYKENTPEDKFSEKKYEKTKKKPLQSGAVIAICMHLDPEINIPEWEEVAATACAVQNMWLSCTTLGIGSYWSSPRSIIEAKDFLQLGENEKCLGLFYMGYSDKMDLPSTRDDIADKIRWF